MIDKKLNILVFPAGSEIGLEIYNSLRYNLHVNLFGASGKADHAKYIYPEQAYEEGDFYINRPDFIQKFNEVLIKFKIDLIFPTHDSIVLFLAKHRDELKGKVITSPYETTRIAREKKLTYDSFRNFDFCPKTYPEISDDITFPLFLKPNEGQGGKGSSRVDSMDQLVQRVKESPDLVICEYLPGDELSVDCFSNRNGELLFIGPRKRHRVEMGISFNTFGVPLTQEIRHIAEALNEKMKFRGAWFFQIKKDAAGKFKLLEFAPRQASTMGLYRQTGVNFALLSVFDAMDMNVEILTNDFSIELDRSLSNRYKTNLVYNKVYIDFDDTIIVNEKVNDVAMRFLYQCRNKGIEIILLTKHRYDIKATLSRFCISSELFDKIVCIGEDKSKTDYIESHQAIFIDNYFFDRKEVKTKLGIPVFDVDAIECLLTNI